MGNAEEPNTGQIYVGKRALIKPGLDGQWKSAAWRQADPFEVVNFHARSSDHRPKVLGKMLYDEAGVYLIYRVEDDYVLSLRTEYQGPVCRDSCAEFFVKPKPDRGYLNFEINCGGTLLLQYHEPDENGEDVTTVVPWEQGRRVQIYHSMPAKVASKMMDTG